MTGTYDKDGHAASATDDGEGQAVGAQGEGDEGEDEDGDLDVEEPDRLRPRHADGGESFCAHGDGVLSTGGVGVEAVFAGVLGWSRIEIVAHKKTRQAKTRRRGGGPGHLYSRPMHASFLLISHFDAARPQSRRHGGHKRRTVCVACCSGPSDETGLGSGASGRDWEPKARRGSLTMCRLGWCWVVLGCVVWSCEGNEENGATSGGAGQATGAEWNGWAPPRGLKIWVITAKKCLHWRRLCCGEGTLGNDPGPTRAAP